MLTANMLIREAYNGYTKGEKAMVPQLLVSFPGSSGSFPGYIRNGNGLGTGMRLVSSQAHSQAIGNGNGLGTGMRLDSPQAHSLINGLEMRLASLFLVLAYNYCNSNFSQ